MNRLDFEDWPQFLAGCLLGDGYRSGNAIISRHTDPQKAYVLAKYEAFLGAGLRASRRLSFSAQTNLGRHLYSQVKVWCPDKRLFSLSPIELCETISPAGLLIWWLDNGSLTVHNKKNGRSVARFGYLNSQRYNEETNRRLAGVLKNRWDFDLTIHKDTGGIGGKHLVYYRLYFNATNMRKLIDVVRPWLWLVPKSMTYKINMDYRPNKLETSAEFSKNYNF